MTSAFARQGGSLTRRALRGATHALEDVAQYANEHSGAAARRRVILCYHSIHPEKPFASASPAMFADHLDWLDAHCEVVPLAELREGNCDAPRPRVAITFDDGYLDNWTHAFPLLVERGLTATFFLTVGLLERDPDVVERIAALWGCERREVEPLDWEHAQKMVRGGMSMGAHTWSHPNLTTLTPEASLFELRGAKQLLENRLDQKVDAIAYPFGRWKRHVNQETIASARASEYEIGVLTLPRAVRRGDDVLRLPRLVIGDDDVAGLARKVRGAIDWHAAIHEHAPRIGSRTREPAVAESPMVSAVITTYNYARFLPTAIQSVLDQSYPNLEILVVDDGSTDDTRAVAETYADRNVRYVYQDNRGAGAARNTGLAMTTGPIVAFLDADDVWLPDKIEVQVAHLQRYPEVALVSCHAYGCEPDLQVIDTVWAGDFAHGHAFERLLLRNFVLNPTCVLVRRDAFDASGGFSEIDMWEDWDTWLRIARRHEIGFTPRPLAKVRRHNRGLSPRSGYRRLAEDQAVLNRHVAFVTPKWKQPIIRLHARAVAYLHAGRAAAVAGDLVTARRFSERALLCDPTLFTRQKLGLFVRTHAPGTRMHHPARARGESDDGA